MLHSSVLVILGTLVRQLRAGVRELVVEQCQAAGEPVDAEAIDAKADAEYRALFETLIKREVEALGLA